MLKFNINAKVFLIQFSSVAEKHTNEGFILIKHKRTNKIKDCVPTSIKKSVL